MRRNTLWILAVLALGAMLAFGPAVSAQSSATGTQPANDEQQMSQDLKLTQEQHNQVKSINQGRKDQIKAVSQDSALTGQQKAARIREINKNSNSQISGLLNTDQRQRFERRWRDRREDVRDRREDVRDRREDVRDAKHDGGKRDRMEDRRDRREDVRDRREDRRDRKTPPPPKKRP